MSKQVNPVAEELACRYVQQVGAALQAAFGAPGEWGAARAREQAARQVLAEAGAHFAPERALGGFGHATQYISGDVALRAGFLLHPASVLEGSGIAPEDVIDDGKAQVAAACVGVLADGRAVFFYAVLSVAQAIGVTPPDDAVMAEAVASAARKGELEWWFA